MDRRTVIFVLLSTVIFVAWSLFMRKDKPDFDPGSATSPADVTQESPAGAAEGGGFDLAPIVTPAPASGATVDIAEAVRDASATTIITDAYEVEIVAHTASLRAWRLNEYPRRNPKGRLGTRPVDLIPVNGPDYGGLRINGESLAWTAAQPHAERISLATVSDAAVLAYVAQVGSVEITKTFTFRGSNAVDLAAGKEGSSDGFGVDVELTFTNLGPDVGSTVAHGYELRWGPGIAMDRERYDPKGYGVVGGLLSTGELVSASRVTDLDYAEPGPQDKHGESLDPSDTTRTAWAAIHSKYFLAALLAGDLPDNRGNSRRARFSEYDAYNTPAPREPARFNTLLSTGKDWLLDDEHFGQAKTTKTLIIPTGKRRLNDDVASMAAKDMEDADALRKTEQRLARTYADYGDVMNLLTGTRLEVQGFYLDPGETITDTFRMYGGPKHTTILSEVTLPDGETPAHMDEIIRYGFTGPLAKGLLWLLKFFHRGLGNYGLAIVVLTLIVRGAMFPISQRSSQGMKKMQARMKIIQPDLDAVRSKHKADPQRVNTETLKIYQKYGVNPAGQLGGCLMIGAQMPIFFAMFSMLRNAAELRGAPFMFWIDDLTAPDMLLSVGGFPIRILPLIMTGGTLLQQKMNPAAGSMAGGQQRMMMMMPLIFLFMLYNMASGLNLYWGISTLLGVGQQYMVNKYGKSTGEEEMTAQDLERMATKAKKQKRQRRRPATSRR
jgi:YidC/Oxa1 family membrane protein insertase